MQTPGSYLALRLEPDSNVVSVVEEFGEDGSDVTVFVRTDGRGELSRIHEIEVEAGRLLPKSPFSTAVIKVGDAAELPEPSPTYLTGARRCYFTRRDRA